MTAEAPVTQFLAAVESMNAATVAGCFTEDAVYQNVPHPPVRGPAAIADLFRPILSRCQRVHWEIVSASFGVDMAWLERVDRFWIDGVEYRIECNGVAVVDTATGRLRAFRDYLDLGVWQERLAGAALRRW